MQRIIINIGDIIVSSEPALLETVLGSCVSVCLWNERLRIGGMNHFMLPQTKDNTKDKGYYGCESIHEMVNKFIRLGSAAQSLKAKVFGGSRVNKTIYQKRTMDIGKENVRIAKDILDKYSISVIKEFTGPDYGIKVIFCTSTGRAFIKRLGVV
ncbi:MAG: chemotaxis protein CheD [Deltaproteobacteria bacterium]|nr:chemotaxis protein CheD [Deltaproteobacteria bacterium]